MLWHSSHNFQMHSRWLYSRSQKERSRHNHLQALGLSYPCAWKRHCRQGQCNKAQSCFTYLHGHRERWARPVPTLGKCKCWNFKTLNNPGQQIKLTQSVSGNVNIFDTTATRSNHALFVSIDIANDEPGQFQHLRCASAEFLNPKTVRGDNNVHGNLYLQTSISSESSNSTVTICKRGGARLDKPHLRRVESVDLKGSLGRVVSSGERIHSEDRTQRGERDCSDGPDWPSGLIDGQRWLGREGFPIDTS